MTATVIHEVLTVSGRPRKPVGVWIVDGANERHFYPQDSFEYFERGARALFELPFGELEAWAVHKANTSSSWRIYTTKEAEMGLLFEPSRALSPEAIYKEVREQYEALLATLDVATSGAFTPGFAPRYDPPWGSSRFATAESWWLAGELTRRHPEIIAYETHPGGGTYDVLRLGVPRDMMPGQPATSSYLMLNRNGTIHIEHPGADPVIPWVELSDSVRPLDIVERLEAEAGWGELLTPQEPTRRSLTYQFFGAALSLTRHERALWDIRSGFFDTAGRQTSPSYLSHFPKAAEGARSMARIGMYGEPESRNWALLRDGEPMAIVSDEALLYNRNGKTADLMAKYSKFGARLMPLAFDIMKSWLE